MQLVATHTDVLKDTLSESFQESLDGYWYPLEPGVPLVRVQVGGGAYSVERRRDERTSWMPITTMDVAEFDPVAFRIWRERWQMVKS